VCPARRVVLHHSGGDEAGCRRRAAHTLLQQRQREAGQSAAGHSLHLVRGWVLACCSSLNLTGIMVHRYHALEGMLGRAWAR
jgi:hypothetical protein